MKESQLQKKILDYLEAREWVTIKIITANKAGNPDIIACRPDGKFVGIEVKTEGGKLSELQKAKLNNIAIANGLACAVYGWDDFVSCYNNYLKV